MPQDLGAVKKAAEKNRPPERQEVYGIKIIGTDDGPLPPPPSLVRAAPHRSNATNSCSSYLRALCTTYREKYHKELEACAKSCP